MVNTFLSNLLNDTKKISQRAHPLFKFPRKTWGSLIGDRNRYIRNEWDNKLCNDLVGSSKGEKCKGNSCLLKNIFCK